MTKITYLKGDATKPIGEGCKIIAHICNNIGGWGSGFVLAISERWKEPEQVYRIEHEKKVHFLGDVLFVHVEEDIVVANMIAQSGTRSWHNLIPVKYQSVEECLEKVAKVAIEKQASVHMPRIGCGLGGGSWDRIGVIVENTLCEKDIPVYVYDLE